MKVLRSTHKDGGFTFIDLLIVLVTVVLMAGWALPWMTRPRPTKSKRINCISNLKQIGLAARMWSSEHGDKFPWRVSTNQSGTLEYAGTIEVVLHFMALSNELCTPKVLACSSDSARTRSTNWSTLTNINLSYFVGLEADETKPQLILSGDRNITTNGRIRSGILTLTTNSVIRWTADIHKHAGNVGLSDGSAQQVNDAGLQAQLKQSPISPVRLVIP